MKRIILLALIVPQLLVGCRTTNKDEVITPAIEMYNKGLESMNKGKYKKAASQFDTIYFQHPGNSITSYAELMQAYALYKDAQYEEAVDVLDNFVKFHPMHQDIEYAYYLRSLASYMQISDIYHDQLKTVETKKTIEDLINRFPRSNYTLDMKSKLTSVNEHLMGKEMEVGRYYLNRKNPIAAIMRFNTVSEFQETLYTPESLYRIAEGCTMLGLLDEAIKYTIVLKDNYPDSPWYTRGHNITKLRR